MKQIDKEKYFKFLAEAENDPMVMGVVVSKTRMSGVDAANRQWQSIKLKEGKVVGIQMKEESQGYIDSYVKEMKERYGIEVSYRKLYRRRLTPEGLVEDKTKFIGYEISPSNNKEGV